MRRAVLSLSAFALAVAVPLAMASAQVADDAAWTRFTSGNQVFSVELPCAADVVATQSPLVARERRVDPAAALGCVHDGRLFSVTQSTLREHEQPGRPFFDALRDAVATNNADNGPTISETTHSGRRMLVSREISGPSIGQVHIIELNDRSCLVILAGGEVRNTMSSLIIQGQMDRFFASVEIAS